MKKFVIFIYDNGTFSVLLICSIDRKEFIGTFLTLSPKASEFNPIYILKTLKDGYLIVSVVIFTK